MTDFHFIVEELQKMGSIKFKEGLDRFGINSSNSYGIRMPDLRAFAKTIGKNQELSLQLWETGQHETRILATLIGEKRKVTERQMDAWVKDFNSWDVCDQCIGNLFDKTPWAYEKAIEWSKREKEFEKRAGFAMMAMLAVHDKKEADDSFIQFFPYIMAEAIDGRNFVKKAVNWAIRQIGKRNRTLNSESIDLSKALLELESASAKWIAQDAIKELESDKIQARLK